MLSCSRPWNINVHNYPNNRLMIKDIRFSVSGSNKTMAWFLCLGAINKKKNQYTNAVLGMKKMKKGSAIISKIYK